MRNKVLVFLMAAGLMFGASGSVHATGSTHVWAPSTDVQAFGVMHITSDFYVPVENDTNAVRPDTITNLGLTTGILPFEKLNAEVGFDHKSGTGLDDYPIYFNAKVGTPEDAFFKYCPALAIGIYDVGTKEDTTDFNVWYAKAAKTLYIKDFSLGRFSAGYFNGNSKLLRYNDKKDNDGVLLCWERTLSEITDKLWVAVEYQGSKSSYGTFNLGASYKFSDNVALLVGYDIYNNRNLADTFTVQVDIDFDVFSKLSGKKT